jgi:uncharacterized protein
MSRRFPHHQPLILVLNQHLLSKFVAVSIQQIIGFVNAYLAAVKCRALKKATVFFALRFPFAMVLISVLFLGLQPLANAQNLSPVPKLTARVTDLTATLSASDKSALESKLQAFEQRKGSQIAVLIVGTTSPEAIEQYSIRVVEAWKLGRASALGKKVDDGVLLLVAKDDRKVRIEVGYGLEGSITDALAKRIISEQIAPRFRAGDFVGGVNAGVDKLTSIIEGAGLPDAVKAPSNAGTSGGGAEEDLLGTLLPILIIAFFSSMIFGRIFGSLATGGAAAFLATGTAIAPPFAFGLAAVGTFILASVLFGMRRGVVSSPSSWNNRRGSRSRAPVFIPGGWGGGGGFGGGSSGGGFGGGGGGFGGGGASGDW